MAVSNSYSACLSSVGEGLDLWNQRIAAAGRQIWECYSTLEDKQLSASKS